MQKCTLFFGSTVHHGNKTILLLLPYTDPFSLSERLLCYFALYLAAQDLASQTMKSYHPLFATYKFQWACQTPRSVFPTNVEENTGRY